MLCINKIFKLYFKWWVFLEVDGIEIMKIQLLGGFGAMYFVDVGWIGTLFIAL